MKRQEESSEGEGDENSEDLIYKPKKPKNKDSDNEMSSIFLKYLNEEEKNKNLSCSSSYPSSYSESASQPNLDKDIIKLIRNNNRIMKRANSYEFWSIMDLLKEEQENDLKEYGKKSFYSNRSILLRAYKNNQFYVQCFTNSSLNRLADGTPNDKYSSKLIEKLKEEGVIISKTFNCLPCFCI